MLLPSALPNETLYSRICRFLALSGESASQFLKTVYGDDRYSFHPFLNANLKALESIAIESASTLWQEQTLAPLFSHFLPKYREQIRNLDLHSYELHRACQLSSFKETESLVLKYCPLCAAEDIHDFGVAYWHLDQQIIGVDACFKHNIWLLRKPLPRRVRISSKLLPQASFHAGKKCPLIASEFAQFSSQKLKTLSIPNHLEFNHLNLLKKKGFVTKNQQIRRKKLFKQLNEMAKQVLPENSALLPSKSEDFGYWSKVIKQNSSQPPFKHMLLVFVLEQMTLQKPKKPITSSKNNDGLKEKCILLLIENLSISKISRQTGKSRCFIKSLAQKEGIDYGSKPKLLTKDVRKSIIQMAWKGFHRKAIANKFQLSTGSIEQVISSIDGLVQWRKRGKYESKRRRHKLTLLRYIKAHPEAIRKAIKRECYAAFFWFYLNERFCLENILPKANKTRQALRTDWNKRDLLLFEEVNKILTKTIEAISRTEIDRRVGKHGWLISYKNKLPLTMNLLLLAKLDT